MTNRRSLQITVLRLVTSHRTLTVHQASGVLAPARTRSRQGRGCPRTDGAPEQRRLQVSHAHRAQPPTPCPPPPALPLSKPPGTLVRRHGHAQGERERPGEKGQGGLCVQVTCPPRRGSSSPNLYHKRSTYVCLCASHAGITGSHTGERSQRGRPRRITAGRNRFVTKYERRTARLRGIPDTRQNICTKAPMLSATMIPGTTDQFCVHLSL